MCHQIRDALNSPVHLTQLSKLWEQGWHSPQSSDEVKHVHHLKSVFTVCISMSDPKPHSSENKQSEWILNLSSSHWKSLKSNARDLPFILELISVLWLKIQVLMLLNLNHSPRFNTILIKNKQGDLNGRHPQCQWHTVVGYLRMCNINNWAAVWSAWTKSRKLFSVHNHRGNTAFSLMQYILNLKVAKTACYVEALCYQKIKTLNQLFVLGPPSRVAFYMQIHLRLHVY